MPKATILTIKWDFEKSLLLRSLRPTALFTDVNVQDEKELVWLTKMISIEYEFMEVCFAKDLCEVLYLRKAWDLMARASCTVELFEKFKCYSSGLLVRMMLHTITTYDLSLWEEYKKILKTFKERVQFRSKFLINVVNCLRQHDAIQHEFSLMIPVMRSNPTCFLSSLSGHLTKRQTEAASIIADCLGLIREDAFAKALTAKGLSCLKQILPSK